MREFENEIETFQKDGFIIKECSKNNKVGFRYCLLTKKNKNIIIMSNAYWLFVREITLISNVARYERQKFFRLLFGNKSVGFIKMCKIKS